MKAKCNWLNGTEGCSHAIRFIMALAVAGVTWTASHTHASGQVNNVTTNTVGSGKQYKTTVERQTNGELWTEDLNQASLLSSQLLMHLNNATEHLTDGHTDSARPEIEQARRLAGLVRGLLPETTVTTIVRDAQGKEVYRDVQKVQDDQIPIFEQTIAVEVVDPILEAKKDEAALEGFVLTDADLIHTAVLMNLDYVERKLRRAEELIAKPEDAAEELILAQTQGVQFFAHSEDSPLVNVQHALRLAERMVREEKFEGAKANLQLARLGLETYRGLIGDAAGRQVSALEKEIQKMSSDLQAAGTADKIGGFWDQVATWFKREPGQAQATTEEPKEKP